MLVYSWGRIENNGAALYTQAKPHMQDSKNIVGFSCGNAHTVAVDSEGSVYVLGNNDLGQLGMHGERFCKTFKKLNNNMIGNVQKVFAISDCTFFVNDDCEAFYCGKHSYQSNGFLMSEEQVEKIKQAEFSGEFKDLIAITGSVGTYYATDQSGRCYKWDVDNMVKFKEDRDESKVVQRYVEACRGSVYRVRSTIKPELCGVVRKTEELKTYEPIEF